MKSYESDDDLDRALFALELDEPPADLRARILAATIYRAPLPVRAWESVAIGLLVAFVVWLAIVALQGGTAPLIAEGTAALSQTFAQFARLDVLFWIALGASAAFWISQLNLIVAPGASRTIRR